MFLWTFENQYLSSYSCRLSILPTKFFFSFSVKSLERKALSHLWRMAGREFQGIGTAHFQWWWPVHQEAHSSFQERRRKQQLPFHFQNPKPHNKASPWRLSQSPVPLQTANKILINIQYNSQDTDFLMHISLSSWWSCGSLALSLVSATLLSLWITRFPSSASNRYIVLQNTAKINVYMSMSQNLDQISRGSPIASY